MADPDRDPEVTDAPTGPDSGGDETELACEAPPPQVAPTFLGQVIEGRSWPLIAIALAFGLLLAAAPLLFLAERSPYAEALATYDALCTARAAGDVAAFRAHLSRRSQAIDAAAMLPVFPCVDRTGTKPTFDPVAGTDPAAGNAWILTVQAAAGTPLRMRFLREDDAIRWDPGI